MSRWKKRRKKPRIANRKANGGTNETDDRASVAVCIPSDDYVHAAMFLSTLQMMMQTMVTQTSGVAAVTVQHVGASILPHSRYTLVKKALEHDVTHLLFIDSDMTFPADTLIRLLRHDVDMIGVNAMSRRPPYHTTAWIKPNQRATTTRESTGIEKAWRTGFALVLIRAEVFKALKPPYFDYQYIPETDQFRGEDYIFFDRALAAGFELYIDHDLSKLVNHIGSFAYNPVLEVEMQTAPQDTLRQPWEKKEERAQILEAR